MTSVIREHEISPRGEGDVDVARLERMLRSEIRGEVRFDDGSRALYAADASNYRQTPIGVVIPRDPDDIEVAVAAARHVGAPVLPRGCGTSLAGQCCNVALVLDCSKYMTAIGQIDPDGKVARVQPGVRHDQLVVETERYGLTFGPDTSTHKYATIGGMIGNNSCGVRSVLASFAGTGARTSDNLASMDILAYDGLRLRVGPTGDEELEQIIRAGGRRGEIYGSLRSLRDRYADQIRRRMPDIPRRVSGFNLDELLPENGFNVARALVGSEGTCVTILEADVLLIPSPPERVLLVLGYPDVYSAGDHVPDMMKHRPTGCEGIDDELLRYMRLKQLHTGDIPLLPEGGGWLLVEFGGDTQDEAAEKAQDLMRELSGRDDAPHMRLLRDTEEQADLWEIRESGLGATAFVPNEDDAWPGWEDSAVPPERVGDYLRDLRGLYAKYGYDASLYGHFGQGCIHTRIDFDLRTAAGIEHYKAFTREAAELVVNKYGGSLSGEHGDGQARGELLPIMYGDELVSAFREFKAIWDPAGKMNPGKVVDPFPRDVNLRLGAGYEPPQLKTYFQFPEDQGSFARATLRCVGVGKCRRHESGTMCPSFQVLHEEQHTTRGRAHLLFEMLKGETISEGWGSEYVKDALDLCLACKGCKHECPVNVDMATYKAEFLAHYYEGRIRPRSALAFGLIFYWARLAALVPQLANLATHAPGLRGLAKYVAGVAPEREVPRFAPETFKAWFRRHKRENLPGPTPKGKVILWPDTFNNHFHPATAAAAVEVLENAGYEVTVPRQWLCCGRPLYDYGMLGLARKLLQDVLEALRDDIRAGVPLIGLEPSCAAVFRDELGNLFPHDEDARRLAKQTHTLGEFLASEGYQPPRLEAEAILHAHCHHRSLLGLNGELDILKRMGLSYHVPDDGCCGMAGSFGFERGEKYDLSVRRGDQQLLPAVRAADDQTLVVSDGFSCKTQIEQGSDRHGLHLGQVLQLALRAKSGQERPEERAARLFAPQAWPALARSVAAAAAAALAVGGAVGWAIRRR